MAMGKRKRSQGGMWIPTSELPRSPGHPFYVRLNRALDSQGFDAFVEAQCSTFYAPVLGRPSLAPGRYFRLLLVGYFEGLDSERGMAWRAADSLAVRSFLGLGLDEQAPDHSTISRTRRLIDLETHREVFGWIQERLAQAGLLQGKTIAIDATTLEANAAMRSIVRRDTGETYQEFLKRLAKASGIRTPSRQALARLDRLRKKKGSNEEWKSPADPDAKITKMKDGRTHLAHKAEQAVDMTSGAIVAVTIQGADQGDTTTVKKTLAQAETQIARVQTKTGACHPGGLQEVVADKGYHSTPVLEHLEAGGLRGYISEPDRGRRKWRDDIIGREAVYANRRRNRGTRGQRLHRARGERAERPFAHLYRTGRMRRTHLRGHENILKRLLVHSGAFNLGLLMRRSLGVGTPRGLQGRLRALLSLLTRYWRRLTTLSKQPGHSNHPHPSPASLGLRSTRSPAEAPLATGC
ncbi:MAG: transposase [Gammaproteobacteria bacterium]